MAVYAAKLPVNHPFKTVALRGLGALSEQQREQAFIEMFPYMKREIEESGVPDRFDNMWPIKMEEDGKALFFNTRGMNIFTTVEDMLRGDVLNMLSPLVKIPIERSSGRETFTNREYKTGDAGVDYQGKEKQVPPLGEHILNQFQQYKLLKQSLVPAQQYDSGTLMNPEPILDKITGEYKYPIESVEKWFNYIGIDTRTTDVRKVFDSYKQQKAAAIGETFNKQQSKADTALTLKDIKGILQELKSDKVKWNQILKDIQTNEKQKGIEQKKIFKKVRNEDLRSFLQPKNEYDVYPIAANLIRGLGYERPVRDTLGKVPIVGDIAADMLLSPFSAYSYGVGQISAKYASKLSGTTNPSIKSALSMQKKIDKAVDGGRTEFSQNPDKPFFEKNTDYVLSVDPDVLCQKSAGADLAVQKLKSSLGDKYTNDMAFELIAAAKERQLRVACPQCYVFSARSKPGVAMQKKVVVGEGGYAGEINKLTAHQMDILTEKALRNYSSTDFKPTHLPGQIVQKVEAAKRGIPEASYTKEPVYADIFGPTGEYINMSIGRNADISMDVNAAMKARGKYPNVSTIYVGFTDAEVRTAINNPMVDHGIPWHSSGQKVEQMRKTLNDPDVHDYTGWQNETVVAKTAKKIIKSAHKIYDSEHGGDLNTYLGLAKRRNVIPKFPQFIMKDKGISDGLMDVIEGMKQSKTQSTKPLYDYINTHQENINPNYMKLIGPEYGKFGGEYPYKPSDMSKINIRKAQSELSRYLKDPESLIPRRQDFLDIADQLIKKYK
jgi:hypothetical protein